MRNAFAPIVRARPVPTFGRPVHLRGRPHRLRPGTSPQALRIPPRDGHPALRSFSRAGSRSPLAVSRFPLRARLELSIPVSHFGQRGITPASWIRRSSSERQRDFNPPDQCAARRTLRAPPPPSRLRPISRWKPVIRPTLLHRFLGGTRTASPVAQRILVTVLPLPVPVVFSSVQ